MQLLDLLFPVTSLTGTVGEWITEEELKQLAFAPIRVERPQLKAMGCKHLDRVVAASSYEASPLLRQAIYRCKYRRIPAVGERLGQLLVRAVPWLAPVQDGVLCPVPLHWSRRFWRGFNQARILSDAVSTPHTWEVRELLRRRRATGSQMRRKRSERKRALHGAFALQKGVHISRHVILVDDVCTSGATLDACAKILKREGAQSVQALVLALG